LIVVVVILLGWLLLLLLLLLLLIVIDLSWFLLIAAIVNNTIATFCCILLLIAYTNRRTLDTLIAFRLVLAALSFLLLAFHIWFRLAVAVAIAVAFRSTLEPFGNQILENAASVAKLLEAVPHMIGTVKPGNQLVNALVGNRLCQRFRVGRQFSQLAGCRNLYLARLTVPIQAKIQRSLRVGVER